MPLPLLLTNPCGDQQCCRCRHLTLVCLALGLSRATISAAAADPVLLSFQAQQLSTEYYSEGAGAGDLNNDGHLDVVYGPHWYEGPKFEVKHEIYEPTPQNREGYANHFFAWVHDFDRDGWNDVFVVGFPGTPAHVYRNPGKDPKADWSKHQVFDSVSNESPQLVDLVGDDTPELVCTRDGFFGYASIDPKAGLEPWRLHADGWFEQPADLNAAGGRWLAHKVKFTNSYGGAEMYAYDVDGDGDQDVITSLAAHDYGRLVRANTKR